ncbi:hypothetical protein MMC26_007418 [Xylographa opegraphella]|nr:hypothetical protein [Xylographa opegraphella]
MSTKSTRQNPMSQVTSTVMPAGKAEEPHRHWNDWPNTYAFETEDEQRTPVELTVTGEIPSYAAGTLYRTGPGTYKVATDNGKGFAASHWFDGFTQVHRFQILPSTDSTVSTKVFYNSRRTTDGMLEKIRKSGRLDGITFGQKHDPCENIFKKVTSTFKLMLGSSDGDEGPDTENVGVTLSVNMPGLPPLPSLGSNNSTRTMTLMNKTDASVYQRIDPETLEPIGLARQTMLHPDLKGPMSAAHARTCPITGDVYNFNLDLAKDITYRVFGVSASSQKTTILATITDAPGAYLHSLFLTTNYVILCIWGSHYAYRGLSLVYEKNIVESIAPLDPAKPVKWYVIDRSTAQRGVIAVYHTPAFYCFHTINAYEEPSSTVPGETDIIADLCGYDDLSLIHRFYYENVLSNAPGALKYTGGKGENTRSWLGRYRLPGVPKTADGKKGKPRTATRIFAAPRARSLELPTMNPAYVAKAHRYVYGVTDRGSSTFFDGLAKFDFKTQSTIFWQQHAQTAGEPIFVRNPQGTDEDDGVLLSAVLDGYKGKSYLLCLDAKDLTELGRADLNAVIGFGFHGTHVPSHGDGEYKVLDC